MKVRDWDELFNKADGLGLHCAHSYTVLHAECGTFLGNIALLAKVSVTYLLEEYAQ